MPSVQDYEQLTFERRDHGVLLITMDRPDKYNAADEQMHGELARVWGEVSRRRGDAGRRDHRRRAGRSPPAATWPWSGGWPATTTAWRTCSAR